MNESVNEGAESRDSDDRNDVSPGTRDEITRLANDVECIPELNFLGYGVLYSRHFQLPFDWASELNEIAGNASAARSHVIDEFLTHVTQEDHADGETDAVEVELITKTRGEFFESTEARVSEE